MKLVKMFDYMEEISPLLENDFSDDFLVFIEAENDSAVRYCSLNKDEEYLSEAEKAINAILLNAGCYKEDDIFFYISW